MSDFFFCRDVYRYDQILSNVSSSIFVYINIGSLNFFPDFLPLLPLSSILQPDFSESCVFLRDAAFYTKVHVFKFII